MATLSVLFPAPPHTAYYTVDINAPVNKHLQRRVKEVVFLQEVLQLPAEYCNVAVVAR
jgi:hypothetical protein